jgi:predicted amidophosphoribosyltransferase
MPCRGICIRYRASGRYVTGNKRCHQCNLFIKWDGLLCPCCGYKLRTKPRHSKFKERLREQKRIPTIEQAKVVKISYDLPSIS